MNMIKFSDTTDLRKRDENPKAVRRSNTTKGKATLVLNQEF